ncbi:unnamed protein product [Closterium sp. Naga37s-1]|nr:unnamed protein product [Closterium sp. Naga37s-1]
MLACGFSLSASGGSRSLADSTPPHDALPLALPTPPREPIAVSAGHTSSAPLLCSSHGAYVSLATVTRPPHVHCAVGGAQASASLLPPCPFSGGAPLANGTRCCPSSLPAWSAPARASRCRAPLAASRAAPAATAPPGLSSLPICLWSVRLILPPIPARLLPLQRLPAAATPISPLSPSVMRPGIPSTPVSALLLSFWRVDPLRPSRTPLPLSPRLALPLILGHPLLLKRVLGALLFPTAGVAAVRSLRLARASVLVRLCVFGVFRVLGVLV